MTLEKLVCDRVPEIMRACGISARVRAVTSQEERLRFLMAKLVEETAEKAADRGAFVDGLVLRLTGDEGP